MLEKIDLLVTAVCSLPQSQLYTSSMVPPVPPCLTKEDAQARKKNIFLFFKLGELLFFQCVTRELARIYSSQDRGWVTGCVSACVRHSYRWTTATWFPTSSNLFYLKKQGCPWGTRSAPGTEAGPLTTTLSLWWLSSTRRAGSSGAKRHCCW